MPVKVLTIAVLCAALVPAYAVRANKPARRDGRELRAFSAAEAHQGVAVDKSHFYAITNRAIGKYDKQSGKLVAKWQASDDSTLRHLNSGVVVDGRLYAAHSNWPAPPLENSIEIWDVKTMKHVARHELEEAEAAVTWVDQRDGDWWVALAHYGDVEHVQRSTLVRFDSDWQRKATWRFPVEVVKRFVPFSNSGGSFGPDDLLYVTGHDRAELYVLRIPDGGDTLELVDIVSAKIEGQGIAWDRTDAGVLYGIRRKSKEVVVSRIRTID